MKNIPASVRQRLLDRAKKDKRPFDELLRYYAMERFLFRLSQSGHASRFILKGALILRVWSTSEFRSTMDIDMLGKTENEEFAIVSQIREIMVLDVKPDGLTFEPDSIRSEKIIEDADYEGIRIRFYGMLDSAKIPMQMDIGFGDIIYPRPEEATLSPMLDFPAPRLLCYSRESVIAEKLETLVKLGMLNSRMKDFYDIWLLSRKFDFDGKSLAEAIRLTFQARRTQMPAKIEAFEDLFIQNKQIQWLAFHKRLKQDHVPQSFKDIISGVRDFLAPITYALSRNTLYLKSWSASGSWS